MEVEKDSSPLWNLYQQIINDMKNGTPMWEEFISKATKLHTALKSTLAAVAAFLDAFQKIADAATNARGATKEIGTALTRMCLRHRAIETRMKTFISTLADSLIAPLSERAEDWRRGACSPPAALGREYARECKRARAELRRRALEAQRQAKKARRPGQPDAQRRAEVSLQDVQEKRRQLEDMEETAVKAALVEERSRFCQLVSLLDPVVESEVAMLAEVSHLQEGNEQLLRHISEPRSLPPASLQVICDVKALGGGCVSAPHSPTPSRLSRKSSVCSISSLESASSERRHHQGGSPNVSCSTPLSNASSGDTLPVHNSNNSQPDRAEGRIRSVCSSDSGFRSSDALHLPPLPGGFFSRLRLYGERKRHAECSDNQSVGSASTTPAGNDDVDLADDTICSDTVTNGASSTWPDINEAAQFERAASAIMGGRPHTISAAYEKGHGRPALSAHTFQPTEGSQPIYAATRPPLPMRCSSLERPSLPAKGPQPPRVDHKTVKPSSLPPHLTKEISQALYVNMSELASLAAGRANAQQHNGEQQAVQQEKVCSESSASESSLESSSGYGSQTAFAAEEAHNNAHGHHQPECEIVALRRESAAVVVDSYSVSIGCLEEAVRSLDEFASRPFATIRPAVPKKRPLSMNATCGRATGPGSRRGSTASATGKPPPPVRRSSSITRQYPNLYSHYQEGNMSTNQQPDSAENLPPPPAFLLQPDAETQHSASGINVAETIKQLTEIKHTPASPSVLRRSLQQQQHQQQQHQLQQHQSQPLSTFQQSGAQSGYQQPGYQAAQRAPGATYGQTGHRLVTYLEQNSIYGRKSSINSSSGDIYNMSLGRDGAGTPTRDHEGASYGRAQEKKVPGTIYAQPSQIIAGFNSVTLRSNASSPLPVRRAAPPARSSSAERRASDGLVARHGGADRGVCKLQGQVDFLDKLSASLQNQRRRLDSHKAGSGGKTVDSHTLPDPKTCHSSLMEQIKRGATLRRNKQCNDRSAPNIR